MTRVVCVSDSDALVLVEEFVVTQPQWTYNYSALGLAYRTFMLWFDS